MLETYYSVKRDLLHTYCSHVYSYALSYVYEYALTHVYSYALTHVYSYAPLCPQTHPLILRSRPLFFLSLRYTGCSFWY